MEENSLEPFAVRESRKQLVSTGIRIVYAFLSVFLVVACGITVGLAFTDRDDRMGWIVPLYIFVWSTAFGITLWTAFIFWLRSKSSPYFNSKLQSCSKSECVGWWALGSLMWLVALDFFWTDWVLAAKVYQYKG